jgi:hypothetical protein
MLLVVACEEKQITEFTQSDLEQMQQDTNWVKITDIDTVQNDILKVKCIDRNSIEGGILIRSKEELVDVYDSQLFKDIDSNLNCSDSLDNINLDFENRDHIISLFYASQMDKWKRSIFINFSTNEIKYVIEKIHSGDIINDKRTYWSEWISLPKLNGDFKLNSTVLYINEED